MYATVLGGLLEGGLAACDRMYATTRERLLDRARPGNVLAQLLAIRPLNPVHAPRDIIGAPEQLKTYVSALRRSEYDVQRMPAVEHLLFDPELFVTPFMSGGPAALPTSTAVMRELWGADVDHSVDPIYKNREAGVYVSQCYVRVPNGGKRACVVRRQRCPSAYVAIFDSLAAVYPALELLQRDEAYPVCVPIANALALDDGELCYMSLMFKAGPSLHVMAQTAPLQQVRLTLQLVIKLCTSPAHAPAAPMGVAHGDEHHNNLLYTPRGAALIDFSEYSHTDSGFGADDLSFPRELADEWSRVTGCAPARAPPTLREAGARMPLGPMYILAALRNYTAPIARMDSRGGVALHSAVAAFDERAYEPAMRWLEGLAERRGDGICRSDTDIAFLVLEAAARRSGQTQGDDMNHLRRQAVRYTAYGVEALLRTKSCLTWAECEAAARAMLALVDGVRLPR